MKKMLIAALATLALTAQSFAGETCARPDEAMALKTAAVQQKLMVAALYCSDTGAYNHFVLGHRRELQDSDLALKAYFTRAGSGMDRYNSYKTALANNFSLAGLHARRAFCYAADAAFEESDARPLAQFISAQDVEGDDYPSCNDAGGHAEMVAGGSSARRTAER